MSSNNGSVSLPVIDFSNSDLKPGNPTWDSLKFQVRKAAEEYGCCEALFNKIPQDLQKSMNEASEELFQLPLETKQLNVSEKPFHGYFGSSSSSPLHESFSVVEPDIYNKVETTFTNLLYPRGTIELSKILHSFSEKVLELDQMIRRMIVESFGVGKYLDDHMNSTYYILRLTKYKAPETTEKVTGLKAHTDKNIISILYQNQVEGLEIQTRNGYWIPIKFSPHSFLILIGESLNAWTNGRLYSPYHRVMVSGNKPRCSTLFFSVPKDGYIIKALEELVDKDHPLLYKPFDYSDYLKRRIAEDRKIQTEPPLKDYFGS